MVEIGEDSVALGNVASATLHKPCVVVGVPAFNEERSVARVVVEAQKFSDVVVVCDDGSNDLTGIIAERLGAVVVRHDHNLGYGAAIRSLFEHALKLGADILVTLDADGQHLPNEIPQIINPVVEGQADVVIGSRFVDANGTVEMPLYRRFGARVITKMVNGSAKNGVSDAQSGFRAYSKLAMECLRVSEVGMGASVEILLDASKHGLKIMEAPCSCKYESSEGSTSTENPVTHGIGVVMSIMRLVVEEKPLMILGIPGLVCLFAGIGFGVWMLQIYALRRMIETNVALATLSFVVLGFFMLSTGITLYAISRIAKKMNGKN